MLSIGAIRFERLTLRIMAFGSIHLEASSMNLMHESDAVRKILMLRRFAYRSTSLEARTEIGIGIYSDSRRTR